MGLRPDPAKIAPVGEVGHFEHRTRLRNAPDAPALGLAERSGAVLSSPRFRYGKLLLMAVQNDQRPDADERIRPAAGPRLDGTAFAGLLGVAAVMYATGLLIGA